MSTRAGKHQTIFSSGEEARAKSVWQFLSQAGYHPLPVSSTHNLLAPGSRAVHRVDVPAEEMRAAREVLAELGYEADTDN